MKKFLKQMGVTGLMAGMLIAGGCGGGDGGGGGVATAPDLTITKSHVGNFSQGQLGATYTVTVTNSGTAATSGLVTVTDTLPAGLTFAPSSGAGWTVDSATGTATRSDALPAGSSYPVITITVNVAQTAGTPLVNSASVSGGGETNTGNNTANDLTDIGVSVDAVDVGGGNNANGYDASIGAITFNVHPTSNYQYNITKFAAGDKLVFDAGTAISVVNSATLYPLCDIAVNATKNSNEVTICLTRIDPASDALIFNNDSFRTVFGADSLLPLP